MSKKDILTFIITIHEYQKRPDLENVFIVRYVPGLLERFAAQADYFHFVRHWVEGDEYGDSLWLRFKTDPAAVDELRKGVW